MSFKRTMITFNQGDECFNFRIAGIAIDNNHILLHRAAGEAFWTCPGGRAEIAFYFLMELPERSPYLVQEKSFSSVEKNTALEFKWFPIDSDVLADLPLLPSFLQQSLSNLPNSVEQVVERV